MPSLDQLLARVVERKGYAVQGADGEALFAKKGEDALLAAWKLDGPLSAADAQLFLSALDQVKATTGILVAPRGVEPSAKDVVAAAKGVEIWAESRLVVEVGEAWVKDALEGPAPASAPAPALGPAAPAAYRSAAKHPSLIQASTAASGASVSGAAYFMPNRKKEQPADMQATIPQGKGGSLGYAWGGPTASGSKGIATTLPSKPRIKTDQWGNVVKAGQGQAQAATASPAIPIQNAEEEAYEIITTKKEKPKVAAVSAPACTTLRSVVTKEQAAAAVGKPGGVKLALIPQVAFEFDLEMSRPGMDAPVTGKGAILVNALTGELRATDGALQFAAAEPTDARKESPKLEAVDVYEKVKGHILKTYSRTLNVEREVAGNTIAETLKLVPDPDEMGLQPRGVVYMPVWEITTSTGITKIDASSGQQLA